MSNEVRSIASLLGLFYFMCKEIFKEIPDYEGLYQVSNLGNVKSLNYKNKKIPQILKACLSTVGYYHVAICKNGKCKKIQIHQLVAMAFLNHIPCGYKLVVDHINGIKTDNRLINLRIITNRENVHRNQSYYTSVYKGVHWNKFHKKWQAKIRIKGIVYHLGYFNNEHDAHLEYQKKLQTTLV